MTDPAQCPLCNGTGRHVCNGSGQVLAQCSLCMGAGFSANAHGERITCGGCAGTGRAGVTSTVPNMATKPDPKPGSKAHQIAHMLEHLKAARRIAYSLGLSSTSDMISKAIIPVEMGLGVLNGEGQ